MADDNKSEIERDPTLLIPVRGDTVAATRYQPLDGKKAHPALLMYIPYRKDDFISFGAYQPLIEYLARYGYEVVVADMVGTGASTGSKEDPLAPSEGEEAAELIEWLADQNWTTGDVGMFGKSYGGITSLRGAAEQPAALKAIVPIHAPYTGYRDTYVGGSFALYGMGGHWTPLMQVLQAAPPSRRDSDGRWTRIWHERLDDLAEQQPWLFRYLDHDYIDSYWSGREIPVGDISVPTLAISGWRDSYPQTTVEYFEEIDAPKHLLLGPWRHTMPHRGREVAIAFRRIVKQWFDYHIKGKDTEVLPDGEISYWTELNGGGEPNEGTWRRRNVWPTTGRHGSEIDHVTFHLSKDGLDTADIGWERFDQVHHCDHTVGMDTFDGGVPSDTSADDARSITFETNVLSNPVELTGTGRATLRVGITTADPQLTVRVVDIDPTGAATLVTRGHMRLSHRAGHDGTADVSSDEEYTVTVPLRPKSHIFEPGHKIRIAVSGSHFPEMLPPAKQEMLSLRSSPENPSTISFPGKQYDSTPSFDEYSLGTPEQHPRPEPAAVGFSETSWENRREQLTDRGTVMTGSQQIIELPHATMRYDENIKASIMADDPSTAGVERTSEIVLEYEAETVRVAASSFASRNAARANTTITTDETEIFDKTWRWE